MASRGTEFRQRSGLVAGTVVWLIAAAFGSASADTAAQHRDSAGRATTPEPAESGSGECALSGRGGVQVLYDFRAGDGNQVEDRSGAAAPVNLKIAEPAAVRWHADSLEVHSDTSIRSEKPAQRIAEAVRRTQGFTVEAWVRPATLDQDGPARIVTLSDGNSRRNFTLGQEGDRFEVRFRTTETSENGIPAVRSEPGQVKTEWTHVVYTRRRDGQATIYVDGQANQREVVPGAPSNWDDSFHLVLGNETSQARPWRGQYRLVALYNRVLSASEVERHFRAGPAKAVPKEALAARGRSAASERFHTQIAPLLAERCLECHDSAAREGGLDLSRRDAALAGGDNGAAIVPGSPNESLLWQSVEFDRMPHDRPPLADEEKTQLKQWILAGAPWPIERIDPAIYRHGGSGGQRWIQRLTVPEYIATVRSAVGVDIAEEARRRLPADKRADGFRNTAYNLNVDLGHVEAYAELAETIVERMDVVEFASRFSDSQRLTDDNMRGLIDEMGKWLLRGPLDEYEIATFRGISTTVAGAGGGFREAVRYTIQAMLQSPRFIYRIEQQRGDGSPWPVSPYELASRLSYIIWGAPPDEELMQAAEAGELSTCEQVEAQARRMLQDPRAVKQSEQFLRQWLHLDRLDHLRPSGKTFPDWQPELAADMRAETLAFFHEIVWKQQRPLTDLLNAQVAFLTPRLAEHYRVDLQQLEPAPASGTPQNPAAPARYDVSAVPSRGGLLTHGSVLTIGGDDASMVTRGLFILNDLLFSEVGDPPPGLDTTPIPPSAGKSRRDIALERVESASCGGCHRRFEPLAFGLEKFDGLGSYFEIDRHGNQLRDDGEILFPGETEPVAYESSAEMMDLLAASDRVSRCLTRKVTQFALGRPLVPADQPALEQIHRRADGDGGTYSSLVVAIVISDLVLLQRTEASPE